MNEPNDRNGAGESVTTEIPRSTSPPAESPERAKPKEEASGMAGGAGAPVSDMNSLMASVYPEYRPLPKGYVRPVARSLADLEPPPLGGDPDELIKDRFLCRLACLLFVGPTGVGKSSWAMQAKILWALGEPCFGFVPPRPLKSSFDSSGKR